MKKIKKYGGFIKPVIEKEAYFLGASPVPSRVIQDDGDWEDSLPVDEKQYRAWIETSNCTGFGATTQIEMYERKAFGEINNYSDRWVGIISGTTLQGNDPQKVYEAIRKYGLIPEEMLPFSDDIMTIDDYYSFKGADKEACYRAGREWLAKKRFMHEWVFDASQPADEKITNIKTALKFSPLAVAVTAWHQNDKGVFIQKGTENHWTAMFGHEEFSKILDSYEPYKKLVDHNFNYCKRIYIEKISLTVEQISIFQKILQALKEILGITLQQVEALPKPPVEAPDRLKDFCLAIEAYEDYVLPGGKYRNGKIAPTGSLSYRNKNPGNLKYVGQLKATGRDAQGFAIFPTYEDGFNALQAMILGVVRGKSHVYKPTCTIYEFFAIYAPVSDHNNPKAYAEYVAKKVGVEPTVTLQTIIK